MLHNYIKVICALIVLALLASCSIVNPSQTSSASQSTEATADPIAPSPVIVISDSYADQLLFEQSRDYQTEYKSPYGCLITKGNPQQATPTTVIPKIIWQRIRIGLQLDHNIKNKRLDAEFNWYKRNPSYMARVSKRSQRYIYYVVEQLQQANMPLELALLPIVESAYDPFAYSHGRASGIWQFIPSTGRQYKLQQNWWYDGRRDIVASTNAAINYLKSLHKRNKGDWLLALAAYNSGQGTVNKAIKRNRKRGRPTDFWSLDLPRETRSYVPKLLALAKLIDNPMRYGIDLYAVENAPYFAQIETGSQIDLAQAATMAKIDIDEIYRLNPGFNRWATTPSGPHDLLIPIANAQQFRKALTQYPSAKRLSWQRYTMKNGDTLSVLAKRFNTDVETIKQVNKLRNNRIRAGKSLMIPVASKNGGHYSLSADQRREKLQKNRSGGENSKQLYYRVKSGDSLWTIARAHNVTVRKLAHWNGIGHRDILRVGQKLSVWIEKSSTQTSEPTPQYGQRDKMLKKVAYKVRNGDSLARIADKFNLNIREIERWNSINRKKYLQPGQQLTLYIDIMNAVN